MARSGKLPQVVLIHLAGRHSMTTRTIAIAAFVIAVIVLILILM